MKKIEEMVVPTLTIKHLLEFPRDILLLILSWLPHHHLLRARLINKKFYSLASLCVTHCGSKLTPELSEAFPRISRLRIEEGCIGKVVDALGDRSRFVRDLWVFEVATEEEAVLLSNSFTNLQKLRLDYVDKDSFLVTLSWLDVNSLSLSDIWITLNWNVSVDERTAFYADAVSRLPLLQRVSFIARWNDQVVLNLAKYCPDLRALVESHLWWEYSNVSEKARMSLVTKCTRLESVSVELR